MSHRQAVAVAVVLQPANAAIDEHLDGVAGAAGVVGRDGDLDGFHGQRRLGKAVDGAEVNDVDHDALAVGVSVGTCVIEGVAIADNIARGERLVDDIERPFRVARVTSTSSPAAGTKPSPSPRSFEENRERVCLLDRVCVVTGDADLGVDPGLEHRLVGCDGRVGLRREVERDVAGRDVICRRVPVVVPVEFEVNVTEH